jgi:hypothetical protein
VGHAFELARQCVEAIVDGGDVVAVAVLVVLGLPI